jgi:hypothetical protein
MPETRRIKIAVHFLFSFFVVFFQVEKIGALPYCIIQEDPTPLLHQSFFFNDGLAVAIIC